MEFIKNKWFIILIVLCALIGIQTLLNLPTKDMPQAMYIEPDYRWYGINSLSVYSESDKAVKDVTLENEQRDKITELINSTKVSAMDVLEPKKAKKIVTQTAVAGNGIPFDFSIYETSGGNYYLHIESLEPPVGIWHKIKESDLPDYYLGLEKTSL